MTSEAPNLMKSRNVMAIQIDKSRKHRKVEKEMSNKPKLSLEKDKTNDWALVQTAALVINKGVKVRLV